MSDQTKTNQTEPTTATAETSAKAKKQTTLTVLAQSEIDYQTAKTQGDKNAVVIVVLGVLTSQEKTLQARLAENQRVKRDWTKRFTPEA